MSSRITVRESVYYQQRGKQPTNVETRFHATSDEKEQAYERTKVIGNQWERIDLGWVKHCGMLVLRNEGTLYEVIPEMEQKAVDDRKVLEIAFAAPGCDNVTGPPLYAVLSITPKASARFKPCDVQMYVRCVEGEVELTVAAFPG
jgi:hypothetical protein